MKNQYGNLSSNIQSNKDKSNHRMESQQEIGNRLDLYFIMGFISYIVFNAFLQTGIVFESSIILGLSSPIVSSLLFVTHQKPTVASKSLLYIAYSVAAISSPFCYVVQ